ncbi:MAG: hypothetical protein H6999_08390 [Hahellaceae bacterium]|nr:hypothetical protein [Hahellaceae bacterium]MCP5169763.1 hypothetical protein [Hahellaceae bacterium]
MKPVNKQQPPARFPRRRTNSILMLSLCITGLWGSSLVSADPIERKICVWDPVGNNGPVTRLIKDLTPKAMSWGVRFKIDAYTDEKVAANDFKAGVCDAVVTTDLSVREFNQFTSTFSAVGGIRNDEELKTLMTAAASPKLSSLMRDKQYEIAGILPLGSVFMYVRDKSIDRVERLQGRKMAVMNSDPVIATMVRRIGGSAVPSSLASMAGQFNNGSVDIIFAPAVAYNVMELYKGIETGGGIVDYPLLHSSLQLTIRHESFPDGFGQHMREYALTRFDSMMDVVKAAESEIPKNYWISIEEDRRSGYNDYMKASRIALRDEGYYAPKALTVMRKVRCKFEPTHSECATQDE